MTDGVNHRVLSLSVAVCTSGRETLSACLTALSRQTRRPDEVLVVNQGEPLVEADLSAFYSGKMIVHNQGVRGLSRARNEACRAFSGDWILWTDDDCEPNAEWVEQIEKLIVAFPESSFFGGALVAPLGYSPEIDDVAELTPLADSRFDRASAFTQVNIIGANFALSRTVIETVGPFDEYLGAGSDHLPCGEETDYLMRALSKGFTGVSSSRPIVYHTYGARPRNGKYGYGMSKGSGGLYWKTLKTHQADLMEYGGRICPFGPKRVFAARLSLGLLFKDQLYWKKEYGKWSRDLEALYKVEDGLLHAIVPEVDQ